MLWVGEQQIIKARDKSGADYICKTTIRKMWHSVARLLMLEDC